MRSIAAVTTLGAAEAEGAGAGGLVDELHDDAAVDVAHVVGVGGLHEVGEDEAGLAAAWQGIVHGLTWVGWSDVELARSAPPPPVAGLARAAAGAVAAPLAVAAVHDDLDVRVVPVVLDEAAVGVLSELRRYHAVDHGGLQLLAATVAHARRRGPESAASGGDVSAGAAGRRCPRGRRTANGRLSS